MSGVGNTTTSTLEIISAYAVQNQSVPAVAADPGWYVVGAFYLPISSPAQIELIGSVSDASLTMKVRLFDMTAVAPVGGALVQTTSLADARATSGLFQLVGQRLYQFQAEVIGHAPGGAYFGQIKAASLLGQS